MQVFRYTATTADGKKVEGTAQANDWQAVDRMLQNRGLKLSGISELTQEGMSAGPRAKPASPMGQKPAQPVSTKQQPPAANLPPMSHVGSPPLKATQSDVAVRTRFASDKDLYFLFSQVASYLKAGVNPAQAFTNLANNMAGGKFGEALRVCASDAAQGFSVANTLGCYPYLFPPHVVGLYRAGEMGGFLPQACESIAEQANNSNKFKRIYWLLGFCVVSLIASIPAGNWGLMSIFDFWDKAEKSGGNLDANKEMANSFWENLIRSLPFTLAVLIGMYVFYRVWSSMPMRSARHKLVHYVPTTRTRVRRESLTIFAWSLSNLFKAGIAPKTAVEAAAATMPNLLMATELRDASRQMRSETKISELVQQISQLSPEMRSIISTGEYVGDLPGALASVADAQRSEFESANRSSQIRVGCWALLVVLAGSVIGFALFYRMFITGMSDRIMDDPLPQQIPLRGSLPPEM